MSDNTYLLQRYVHTVYDGVCHTPLGRFSKRDCSLIKRVPVPNDTCSESSRRDVSNADLLGTGTISNCGDIDHGKSAQGGAIYTVVYGRCWLRWRRRPYAQGAGGLFSPFSCHYNYHFTRRSCKTFLQGMHATLSHSQRGTPSSFWGMFLIWRTLHPAQTLTSRNVDQRATQWHRCKSKSVSRK